MTPDESYRTSCAGHCTVERWCGVIMPRVKASLLQSSHQNADSQHGTVVTRAHLDKRVAANPSVGVLRGDMLESRCRLEKIRDGIYTWWCHLQTQNQSDRDEILPIRVHSPVFSCWFLIKVVEGNKPCMAITGHPHPINLMKTFWGYGWSHRASSWSVVESISNLLKSRIHLGDGIGFHVWKRDVSPFRTHLSPARHPPSACQRWALLEEAGKPLIGRLAEETRQHESREGRERQGDYIRTWDMKCGWQIQRVLVKTKTSPRLLV